MAGHAGVVKRAGAARGDLLAAAVLLPPALLLFTVFVALPIGQGAWYSLFNWDGYATPTNFVGLKNYVRLLADGVFAHALANNGLIIVVSLLVQLPLALGVALLLARRGTSTTGFRTIFFLPYMLADIAAGLIWRLVYDGDYGLLSTLVRALGGPAIYPLADRNFAFPAVLAVIVWKYFGFHMMLYVAGLQQIDKHLYEAAGIDGANAWQRFLHITLPGLAPMVRLSVFFSVVGSLQFFDMVAALTGGGPLNATHTMVSYLYFFGMTRMRVGFGSAVGVVLFAVCVSFASGYRRLFMRRD